MQYTIWLFIIITAKVFLTKGCSLIIILLSFALKGKGLHKEGREWNDYFLKLSEHYVSKYARNIYLVATILSSIVTYFLLKLFEFQYPLLFTLILTVACMVFTLCKYLIKGRDEIFDALRKIRHSALGEDDN